MIDYEGRAFRPVSVTANGEVSDETLFVYRQVRSIVTCAYEGGRIRSGHLIGLVDADGNLDLRYHQLTVDGELQTGTCFSRPELLPDGRVRLHESWQWTSGDGSVGTSIIEEVDPAHR